MPTPRCGGLARWEAISQRFPARDVSHGLDLLAHTQRLQGYAWETPMAARSPQQQCGQHRQPRAAPPSVCFDPPPLRPPNADADTEAAQAGAAVAGAESHPAVSRRQSSQRCQSVRSARAARAARAATAAKRGLALCGCLPIQSGRHDSRFAKGDCRGNPHPILLHHEVKSETVPRFAPSH
jgi:hypothetical protein